MTRSRKTARQAGTSFERLIADYLAAHVDDRIDRRPKTGSKDRGDIGGLRHMGQRIVIECKNTNRIELSTWANEAETERGNDDAGAALVIHKRRGKGNAADQWVTCTLGDFVSLINGNRDHLTIQQMIEATARVLPNDPDHREIDRDARRHQWDAEAAEDAWHDRQECD